MKHFLLIVFIVSIIVVKSQSCMALYSYSSVFEKVNFFNQSNVNNAHYYWNFGDGTSSTFKDPIHEYPGSGTYLVTLYGNDTLTNCSNYFEKWITITQNVTTPCAPIINDSIYTVDGINYYLKILDYSSNCNSYNRKYISVGGNNLSNTFYLGDYPANFISRVEFDDNVNQIIGVKTVLGNMIVVKITLIVPRTSSFQ